MQGVEKEGTKARVFLSYAREDLAFVDRVAEALKAHGFEPLVDRTEIYAFEDWWKRLEALVVRADAVVFVLSPDSVDTGSVCQKEVAFAASLNKRFAPIVARHVDHTLVPEPLRRLNWVDFSDPATFDERMAQLAEALTTDIEWVRKHTEFVEQSRRWSAAGRPGPRGLLLRSPVLEEAERWIASRPHGAPAPTQEAQDFIAESRRAATRRQRMAIAGALSVALVAGALAVWAMFERNRAVSNEARAVAGEQLAKANEHLAKKNEEQAQRERARAEAEERKAKEARDQALATQSRLLAERASRLTEQGDTLNAMLLALEAFRSADDTGPERYEPAAERSLADAVYSNALKSILRGGETKYVNAAFTADGTTLVAIAADGKVSFWSMDDETRVGAKRDIPADIGAVQSVIANPKRPILLFRTADGSYFAWNYETRQKLPGVAGPCTDGAAEFKFDPSGDRLLAFCKSLRVFNLATSQVIERAGPFDRFALAGNGSRYATLTFASRTVQVWDTASGNLVKSWKVADSVLGLAMNHDGSSVLAQEYDGIRIWDAKTGASKPRLRTDQARTFDVYASPTMPLFVTAGDEGSKVWSTAHSSAVQGGGGGQFAAFLPNGLVAFTTDDGFVVRRYLTEGHTGTYFGVDIATLRVAGDHKHQASSADGKRMVTLTGNGDLYLWSTEPPMLLRALDGDDKRLGPPLAVSGDGKIVATPAKSGITLWNADTFAEIRTVPFKVGDTEWKTLRLDQEGKRLLYQDANGAYDVRDVASAQSLTPKDHPSKITTGDLSPDGATAAVALGNRIRIWSLGDATEKRCDADDEIVKLVFTAGARSVAAATVGGAVLLIDTQTCASKRILSFPFSKDQELRLLYRDGKVLAFLAARVQVWDEREDKVVFDSTEEEWPVFDTSAADQTVFDMMAPLKVLVGKATEHFIRVFDMPTRTELLRFRADINDCCNPTDMEVTPAADRLLTQWSERGNFRLRLWRLFPSIDALRAAAKTAVAKCLSPEDRNGFGLQPEPPGWCIEMGKWPYQTDDWKAWLKAKRANLTPPLPGTPEWAPWVKAHSEP
jgi:WD40 repeat protein